MAFSEEWYETELKSSELETLHFFCQFLCPMGAVFAIMPIIPGALFKRNRPNCAQKCTLCKKRCPAHLDIDGDTAHSGECICCHACTAVCPRKNIHTGTVIDKN